MSIQDDISTIARQEKELILPAFDNDIAWNLGLTLRELAVIRESLIKSLIGIYHARVKYPEQRTA